MDSVKVAVFIDVPAGSFGIIMKGVAVRIKCGSGDFRCVAFKIVVIDSAAAESVFAYAFYLARNFKVAAEVFAAGKCISADTRHIVAEGNAFYLGNISVPGRKMSFGIIPHLAASGNFNGAVGIQMPGKIAPVLSFSAPAARNYLLRGGMNVVRIGHFIFRVKFLGQKFIISLVIFEVFITFEEIIVFASSCIPRCVDIVIFVTEENNIPCVSFTGFCGISGDDHIVNVTFKGKAIEKGRVSLTYGGLIDQRRIGAVFEQIILIIKVLIIIFHVFADIIINGADLLILGFFLDVKLRKNGFDGRIDLCLLLRSGNVNHLVRESHIIITAGNSPADFAAVTEVIILNICAFVRFASMLNCNSINFTEQRFIIFLRRVFYDDGVGFCFELFAHTLSRFFYGIDVFVNGIDGYFQSVFRKQVCKIVLADNVRIDGVNISDCIAYNVFNIFCIRFFVL